MQNNSTAEIKAEVTMWRWGIFCKTLFPSYLSWWRCYDYLDWWRWQCWWQWWRWRWWWLMMMIAGGVASTSLQLSSPSSSQPSSPIHCSGWSWSFWLLHLKRICTKNIFNGHPERVNKSDFWFFDLSEEPTEKDAGLFWIFSPKWQAHPPAHPFGNPL